MVSVFSQNQHQSFTDYFLRGCKSPTDYCIGMEVEHLCVRLADQRRIEFNEGDDSVTAILHSLLTALGVQTLQNGFDGETANSEIPWVPELLPATVAVWAGLLYSPQRLDQVLELVDGITDEVIWQRLFASACNHGLEGNPLLRRMAQQTLELASLGLQDIGFDDPRALNSLRELRISQGLV